MNVTAVNTMMLFYLAMAVIVVGFILLAYPTMLEKKRANLRKK